MAQRIPSRHSVAMLESSQSCNPTLKAARNGVQAVCNQIEKDTAKTLLMYIYKVL